jgi:hypothetical protein
MRRVYTDPRFAGFEVHNDGGNAFRVYEINNGQQHEIDVFHTHPGDGGMLPEEVTARRAKDYFDRMAKGRMSDEFADRPEIADAAAPPAPARPPGDPFGLSASKSLDQIMGDNVMTSDDVIDAFEHAKQLPEGPQRDKALAQVRSMSSQLESSAWELVRRLLD